MRLLINEGEGQASVEGIPDEIWEQFRKNAEVNFPKQGKDAWAAAISEFILGMGGGTKESVTYFMTDIPRANSEALEKILDSASWSFDMLHVYLLQVAQVPGALRVINFSENGKVSGPGVLLVTGIDPAAFKKIEDASKLSVENIFAITFMAAAKGSVEFTGASPNVPRS